MERAQATVVTGTAMGLFYALFNGLGRIVWGTVSDKLGRKHSIALMSLIQGVMMIVFYFMGGSEWGLYLGATLIGFNFGGNFALFPAATADLFGNDSVGRELSVGLPVVRRGRRDRPGAGRHDGRRGRMDVGVPAGGRGLPGGGRPGVRAASAGEEAGAGAPHRHGHRRVAVARSEGSP